MSDDHRTDDRTTDTDRGATDPARVERAALSDLDGTGRLFDGEGEPDVVRLRLDAGESVPPHAHPGRGVVFFVVEGGFEVTVAGDTWSAETGDCLRFDGEQEVSPAATDDGPATALVVLGLGLDGH
ncbi:cupin domain-containing protein [Salinigranum salinum]|uniref:cupin domain-containing protein n=1 Tax=Salinigranum salinum TaxID=1364937 RepID=UPI001260458D|nr:cupin domain-containing protein [Salinigranum salinum]